MISRQGAVRDRRGHRHVGGVLAPIFPESLRSARHDERHYEWVALVVAVVAAASASYASYAQAQAQNEQAEFAAEEQIRVTGLQEKAARDAQQAAIEAAEANALDATIQAGQARGQAESAADEAAERNRRVQARARALYGGMGVTTEGTPLLVLMDSAEQAAIEEARIRHAGEVTAMGLETQAGRFRDEANRARAGVVIPAGRVSVNRQSPGLAAGTTLLTGASNIATNVSRTRRTTSLGYGSD
jgi:hypothetical protein